MMSPGGRRFASMQRNALRPSWVRHFAESLRGRKPGGVLGTALLLAMASALLPATSSAQLRDLGVAVGARFESYYFDDVQEIDIDRVGLFSVPLRAELPLAQTLSLGVNGAYARASMRRAGADEVVVSGMTDTRLDLTLSLAQDRLRLSGIAQVPTGRSELTAAEMDVVGVLASDLLPFGVTTWGTGGAIGGNVAVAVPLDAVTSVGVSGGYLVAREYEPLSSTAFAYRPGNQLQVRAAIDRTFASSFKASLQAAYYSFTRDQQDGANLYQPGDRLQVLASLAFAAGASGSGVVYTGVIARDEGQYTDATLVLPAQDLIYFGGALRQPLGMRSVLIPAIDVRLVRSDRDDQTGFTITTGVGLELPLGSLQLIPTVAGRFGELTARPGDESQFSGLDLSVTLRRRGPR